MLACLCWALWFGRQGLESLKSFPPSNFHPFHCSHLLLVAFSREIENGWCFPSEEIFHIDSLSPQQTVWASNMCPISYLGAEELVMDRIWSSFAGSPWCIWEQRTVTRYVQHRGMHAATATTETPLTTHSKRLLLCCVLLSVTNELTHWLLKTRDKWFIIPFIGWKK